VIVGGSVVELRMIGRVVGRRGREEGGCERRIEGGGKAESREEQRRKRAGRVDVRMSERREEKEREINVETLLKGR